MRVLLSIFLSLLPSLLLAQASQPVTAGRVEALEGDVRIYSPAGSMRTAKPGDVVSEGDSIVTGSDGEVHLAMEDEGQIAIRPNTRLRIARYKAEGGSSDTSIIALVQGALRSVTGWIGKYNPKGYAIRTPTATIGVRGTDHETTVLPSGSGSGEAGTYDKVNHGATTLTTQHGSTEVRPDQAGFVPSKGKAKPRLLPSVPSFYRPARLDDRFANLHESVRQKLDVKRSERIEVLRERRQKLDDIRRDRTSGAHPAANASRPDTTGARAGQERRFEHAEQRRQDQNRKFEERRRHFEEQRPGEPRRLQERGSGGDLLHGDRRDAAGQRSPPIGIDGAAGGGARAGAQGERRGPQGGGHGGGRN